MNHFVTKKNNCFIQGSPDLKEIKQRLTKVSRALEGCGGVHWFLYKQMAVPKKLEKFNNFVSNSFKIKDESVSAQKLKKVATHQSHLLQVKKQLWEFVQKNRSEK